MKSEIEKASNAAKAEYLSEDFFLSEHIEIFSNREVEGVYYTDVPLRNVVGMEKRKFSTACKNWREAAKELHCREWEHIRTEIVDYFQSELRDNEFPAPGSNGPLKLFVTGGAAYCSLGNHRLSAAMVWKAHNEGEDATLKKVMCFHQEVNRSLKKLLIACKKGKGKLFIYRVSSYVSYILFEGSVFWKLYKQKRVPLAVITHDCYQFSLIAVGPFQFPKRLFVKLTPGESSPYFEQLPHRLVSLLLDDQLVENAAPSKEK